MAQEIVLRCDCCGLVVDHTRDEICPTCQYPVNPEKEQAFLEASIRDLQRAMRFSKATISVAHLVTHYTERLQFLRDLTGRSASPQKTAIPAQSNDTPALPIQSVRKLAQIPVSLSGLPDSRLQAPPGSASIRRDAHPQPAISHRPALPMPVTSPGPVPLQPAASMRGFSLSSDAVVNVLAALGGFLVLAGALSFVLTTSSLWGSFAVIFLLHIVFGGAGVLTRRRFPQLQAVSTLYTLIFALLLPLAAFSAYRLVTNGALELSTPLLLALASLYAAVIYGLLAVVQRFVPFAYLGIVALLVGDLAFAQTLHLAYEWWPCTALLLALPALVALPRPSGNAWPITESWAILRAPLLILMYSIVSVAALSAPVILIFNLMFQPVWQMNLALFSLSCLLFVWTFLWIWRTGKTSRTPLLAYQFLAVLLLVGYVFNLNEIGYILSLAGIATFYHLLARWPGTRLTAYGLPGLALDQPSIGLSVLVLLLTASATPLQLLYRAYTGSSAQSALTLVFERSWPFAPSSGMTLDLLALGICLFVTFDIAVARAGLGRVPVRATWCWLLVMSGTLLIAGYGLEVLLWHASPLRAFLTLSLALLAGAVLARRLLGPAWANPLDVLTLYSSAFTLLLTLDRTPEIISVFLLGYAALFYVALLYQRRPLSSLLSAALALLALPLLLRHAPAVLGLSLLSPLLAAGMQQAGLFGERAITRMRLFAWVLLGPALLYGLIITGSDSLSGTGVFAQATGFYVPVAAEIALQGVVWYAAALFARSKIWLVPALLFASIALLLPTNTFWIMSALTPCLAILAVENERRAGLTWALPLYGLALLSAVMTGYTGLAHPQALSWVLLGFALLAYGIGLWSKHASALWLTPLFATWALVVAAGGQGDLFRAPLVAMVSAGAGFACSRAPLPLMGSQSRDTTVLRYALPWYTTALAAAILTGVYGLVGDVNQPFYGALPLALLIYALVAFVLLQSEKRSRWNWLVAVFACWSMLLTQRLSLVPILGAGTSMILLGLLSGRLAWPLSTTRETVHSRSPKPGGLAVSWPWYCAFLVSVLILGISPSVPGQALTASMVVPGMLIFSTLALVVMLVERAPEFLLFPLGISAWAMFLRPSTPNTVGFILSCTLLCLLIFAAQFIWRLLSAATRWLPETSLHNSLSLGGLCFVLLYACEHGALSADAGELAHAGVLALVALSLLLCLYGWLHPATVVRSLPQNMQEAQRAKRLEGARALQHWCFYVTGLLFSLAISWELLAFHQTNFDMLSLAPASYLIIVSPLLLRDQALPERRAAGQLLALTGAALLLLPALWLSFNGADMWSTAILLSEALALLALGLLARLRIFILSGAGLIVIGTLRLLFLSVSSEVSILLMVSGSMLVLLATLLILFRHRLQIAWGRWE
jgi:hypothetical protein